MIYEWDEEKRIANLAKHGVDFSMAEGFNWETAVVREDRRRNYGERRSIAVGYLNARLHILIFTLRGEAVRIISLRKANPREMKHYEEKA
jgi:uncharacterized DUF497 family protein